ncbi:MAG: gliding motility-associated C-terminal domain-containing protein [Flavobacteriales bacterium]|nr:gliding motility-associated C-terminal domain-containing protein [Flavobacteriales bacterium]MCB9364560.1 gliding motility-associated C-terminal domain-containing protein [Flavobacteriales bacterium]
MLKNILFYIFSCVTLSGLNAQCPVSVEIVPDKTGDLCKYATVTFTAQPTNGGATPQYYWLFNGDTVSTSVSFTTATNQSHIELIMFSSDGCPQDSAYDSFYTSNITIQADYIASEPTECNQPTNDAQILDITGGTAPYSYYLHTNDEDIAQNEFYTDIPVSSYPLVITDSEGCVDTTWITFPTKECDPIIPSQILTPNGDGINDRWVIANIRDYPENKVYIFDRWGQRVYYKEGYDNLDGWDAKYIGSNLAVSTYYYVIELEFETQDKQVFKGPVSILR